MNRTEALQQFNETYVNKKSNEKLLLLEKYFQEHKNGLVKGFIESFRLICLKIKEMQALKEKGKIGYITYSMLRTAIAERKHTYLIEAFNEQWFLDFEDCHGEYDASWAFDFMEALRVELDEKRKLYFGNVVTSDVESIIQAEAGKFNEYVISLARYAMPGAAQLKEFNEIEKEDELEIRVGEYRGLSEVVYKEDKREKNPEKVREWLDEKQEDEYSFEVFKNLDLRNGNYKKIDLSFADFSGSDLSKSKMTECVLVGTKFTGGSMEGTDLSGSMIYSADFSNCKLKKAVFYRVEGAAGIQVGDIWDMPGFLEVSFERADLEDADFEGADLKGAVFTGANLKNTNFSDANLKDAVFLERDAGILDLDEQQIKSIKWRR